MEDNEKPKPERDNQAADERRQDKISSSPELGVFLLDFLLYF
jgi:hypothetical protein